MSGELVDETASCRLRVTPDGHVTMTKSIPYDGVLTYTTAEQPTLRSRRKRSQDRLSANEVVRRYSEHANTDATFQQLAAETLNTVKNR